jgi:hypothetical protein
LGKRGENKSGELWGKENKMKTFFRAVSPSIILVLISALPIFGQAIPEQKGPPADIKQYLIAKYNLREEDVVSKVLQTPAGFRGYLNIKGRIVPNSVPDSKNDQERVRAVARAFLEEESALLGITNMGEIREMVVYPGEDGNFNIRYLRYINTWELQGAYVHLKIATDGSITSAQIYLMPTPPELYEAVAEKTLTDAEIRKIVEDDMKRDAESPETSAEMKEQISNFDTKRMRPRPFAIPDPPYVIWGVQTAWAYTIDASTGRILKKSPIIRKGNSIHLKLE